MGGSNLYNRFAHSAGPGCSVVWSVVCLVGWLVVGCVALRGSEARGSGFGSPKRLQDGFKMAPNSPKTTQNGLKTAQDSPKTAQDSPKTAQEGPKMPQDGLKMVQDGPRAIQDGIGADSAYAPSCDLRGGPRHTLPTPRGSSWRENSFREKNFAPTMAFARPDPPSKILVAKEIFAEFFVLLARLPLQGWLVASPHRVRKIQLTSVKVSNRHPV